MVKFHGRTKVMNANHRNAGTHRLCIKIAEVSGDQMTMQGLILSQNSESVTKDSTKGKEEARANKHTKKNDNNEVELWKQQKHWMTMFIVTGIEDRPNSAPK